jgi:membrane protease YdiL (CAAX protease family)
MNTDPLPTDPQLAPAEPAEIAPQPATPVQPNTLRKIFFGPNGIRAGWRLLLFLLFMAAFQYLVLQRGLRLIPGFAEIVKATQAGGPATTSFALIFESANILTVFLAAGIMSRIEKRPLGDYGVPLQSAFGKLFWQGCLWGLAFESIELLAISALGGFSLGTLALAGGTFVRYALLWAIGFVLVGIFEESFFRGYALFTLASGVGFWPAAVLFSAIFGAVHLSNPGEGWIGALSVFCFGLFCCFTLLRTGNLWFAIGFHAAGDYAETFIYSVPDSGIQATGHLLNSSLHGPRWLSGGTVGPEASLMAFVMFAITFAAFHWLYPPKNATPCVTPNA